MAPIDFLTIEIGKAGNLDKRSLLIAVQRTVMLLSRLSPITAVSICIGGYDDDPRELYQIQEAREFILDYATGLMNAGIPLSRFLPDTAHLVHLCLAAANGVNVVVSDDKFDIIDALKEYQARVRRTMQ